MGVEDEATLQRLAEDGETVAQGFHIGRPLAPAELEAWLAYRAERRAPSPEASARRRGVRHHRPDELSARR
jgi:predicted signal transduction protein with EAL and GGDEF domain